jgi:hypothetical protein
VPSGVLFSQLLTELKNLAVVAAAAVVVVVVALQTEALIDSVPEYKYTQTACFEILCKKSFLSQFLFLSSVGLDILHV